MVSLESTETARGKGCTKFLFCWSNVGYWCQPGPAVGFRKELPCSSYCPRRKRRGGWSTPTVPGTLKDFGDRLNYNLYKWFLQTKHAVLPLVYRNTGYSFAKISLDDWIISTDISPGKNIRVGSHSLLQVISPNPGIQPGSPIVQAGSLLSEPPRKPQCPKNINKKQE